MYEIEQKYHAPDPVSLTQRLIALGAVFQSEQPEADHYLNAPDRDFATTGEAFRLRRVGPINRLTYKGPKQAGLAVKVRTEIEFDVMPGDEGAERALTMFTSLGYRPVAVVRKNRRTYTINQSFPITICLDDCETVGSFVELEILATDSTRDTAIAAIQSLAATLQLTQPETHSYLRMLLARQGRS